MTKKSFKIPKTAEAGVWLSTSQKDTHPLGTLAEHLPDLFAAYARVLHPAEKVDATGRKSVRWQAVAEANNTKVHRLMQWPNIAKVDYRAVRPTTTAAPWNRIPSGGNLASDLAAILVTILRQFTTTPEVCWFTVWAGHGFDDKPWMQAAPFLDIHAQPYRLFNGPIHVAAESFYDFPGLPYSANMWWPDDHAWLVMSHIDLSSTYIGGSEKAIAAILGENRLEAFRALLDDDVTLGGDLINAAD